MARNTRQQGNGYENQVAKMAEALGYAVWKARGSRGEADLICFCPAGCRESEYAHPPLVVQVGTTRKPIAATLAELDKAPRPIGSRCVVARRHSKGRGVKTTWTFHSAAGKFDTLAALLESTP